MQVVLEALGIHLAELQVLVVQVELEEVLCVVHHVLQQEQEQLTKVVEVVAAVDVVQLAVQES
jgi:hypothetical protein